MTKNWSIFLLLSIFCSFTSKLPASDELLALHQSLENIEDALESDKKMLPTDDYDSTRVAIKDWTEKIIPGYKASSIIKYKWTDTRERVFKHYIEQLKRMTVIKSPEEFDQEDIFDGYKRKDKELLQALRVALNDLWDKIEAYRKKNTDPILPPKTEPPIQTKKHFTEEQIKSIEDKTSELHKEYQLIKNDVNNNYLSAKLQFYSTMPTPLRAQLVQQLTFLDEETRAELGKDNPKITNLGYEGDDHSLLQQLSNQLSGVLRQVKKVEFMP